MGLNRRSASLARAGRPDDALRVLYELQALYPEAPELKTQIAALRKGRN